MDINYSVSINPQPSKGELAVLFSGYSQTSRDHRVGPLVHDHHLLHFVLSGRGTYHCLGKEYVVEKGGAFFIFPGDLVSYNPDPADPWEYRWIGFRGNQADQILETMGITPAQPVIRQPYSRRMAGCFSRIQRILLESGPTCGIQAEGWTRLILGELCKESANPNLKEPDSASVIERQVEQAIRWLTLQYAQPISIEKMAQSLGYHRTHLSKMFKRFTGLSPMSYLLHIRMERARLLLAEPLTVEQVAASVGFTDPLYFSKQFKKWMGLSPTEYRRERLQGSQNAASADS